MIVGALRGLRTEIQYHHEQLQHRCSTACAILEVLSESGLQDAQIEDAIALAGQCWEDCVREKCRLFLT